MQVKKHAFTMLELVMVIVVVGILAAAIVPRFDRNNLQEAADRVISDIRYTQHLAMIDEKFNANDPEWFKKRWQIQFSNSPASDNQWAYTVFSESHGTIDGITQVNDIAKNTNDPNRYLTGGVDAIPYDDDNSTKKLNLGNAYGIKNVIFTNCDNSVKAIAFDYMGRPMDGNISNSSRLYQKANLLTSQCQIALCKNNSCEDNITIAIEPQTGYVHQLKLM